MRYACFLNFLWIVFNWAVKKGQIVRVDKEKYLNSVNVSVYELPLYFLDTEKILLVLQII